jgi:hypothetical protein
MFVVGFKAKYNILLSDFVYQNVIPSVLENILNLRKSDVSAAVTLYSCASYNASDCGEVRMQTELVQ